ncbi:MAG: hypothetical protein WKF80_11775 [Thermomicrobiales bacterium]
MTRLVLGAVLLLSMVSTPARPVSAQSDDGLVDDTTYVSPQFEYEVTWDQPWVADEGGTRSRADRDDVLTLRDEGSDVPLVIVGVNTDLLPGERLELIIEDRTASDPDLRVALDPDNGDDFAAALLAYAPDDGATLHEYVEVSEGEAGEWLLVVDVRVPVEDLAGAFGSSSSVEIDGDAIFQRDPATLLDASAGDDSPGTGERRRPSVPTAEPDEEATGESDDEPTEEPTDPGADAQEGVEGDTYTSPNFDYSVTWDADVWMADETTIENGFDVVQLTAQDSTLSLTATDDFGGDLTACLEDVTDFLADGDESVDLVIDDIDTFEDEDGEQIEGEADDRAFVANEYTGTFDGDDVSFIYYVECRTLVEDEAALIFIHFILDAADYPDEAGAREDLVFIFPDQDGTAADEATATPEEDEEPTPEDERDPTPEDGETPETVDDTAFTSETYGFSLAWDGEIWSEDDRAADAVSLGHGPGSLSVAGVEDYDGDALTCVQGEVDSLRGQPGVVRIEPELGADGRRVSGGDAERFFALYRITATDGTFDGTSGVLLYQECRTLVENDAVLIIQHLVFDPDAYADEAVLADAVIETIEIP